MKPEKNNPHITLCFLWAPVCILWVSSCAGDLLLTCTVSKSSLVVPGTVLETDFQVQVRAFWERYSLAYLSTRHRGSNMFKVSLISIKTLRLMLGFDNKGWFVWNYLERQQSNIPHMKNSRKQWCGQKSGIIIIIIMKLVSIKAVHMSNFSPPLNRLPSPEASRSCLW